MKQHNSIIRSGRSTILYDAGYFASDVSLDSSFFDCDYHTKTPAQQNKSPDSTHAAGIGRAHACYFQNRGYSLVLKHYFRGGMVARFNRDLYLASGVEQTRAFREWRLLETLKAAGLPVPSPIAAHARRIITLPLFSWYRCDLITEELEGIETLAAALSQRPLDDAGWQTIGRCIRLFHDFDVYHADLNARNILVRQREAELDVYLIDFDNSAIRSSGNWKHANLARLKRSLNKFKDSDAKFRFDEGHWKQLLEGYKDN